MKSLIFTTTGITCLMLCATSASAQETITPPVTKTPKFSVGLQAGAGKNFSNEFYIDYPRYNIEKGNDNSAAIGLFARYYMGRHLALQAGADLSLLSPITSTTEFKAGFGRRVTEIKRSNWADIPLQLQYHLLKSDSKIRPYFGMGVATRFNYHAVDISAVKDGVTETSSEMRSNVTMLGLISQGITWQLSNKWQFNQSFNFMFDGKGKGNMDLKLGASFTIK